ncbi:aldo/keto reductase [Acrocarpospora macrocephala]|uniref:Oxidoreductase n=1 Tax=Acrocarpospora macrocephala TaxID=150177 RepID=A0A5M3WXU2_9ACTN|nr:aldo/keto reductase [Acrocarpospora macrocephala]GES11353.1 oxidoreductase [Acrocarpospora macrocephala]
MPAPGDTFLIGGDLPVNRLGLGTMSLTGPGTWGEPADKGEALRVLRTAVELGVNFLDTADAYGPHVSERLIAEALHPYPAGLVIATKGGLTRQGPNRWAPCGRPEYLRQCTEMSLRRLRLDTIDLYHLHRVDPLVPLDDQLGTLADLQREGKIRHLGLSKVSIETIEAARGLAEITTVQNAFNQQDRTSEDVLDYCTAHRIGFIPYRPLGKGRLAGPDPTAPCDGTKATGGQLALSWLLHRSPVVIPIPGTSNATHLRENVQAGHLDLPGALPATPASVV